MDEHIGDGHIEVMKPSTSTDRAEAAIRGLQRMGLADKRLDPAIVVPALVALVNRFAEMWFVEGQVDCTFEHGVEQIATLCMNALALKDTPKRLGDAPQRK